MGDYKSSQPKSYPLEIIKRLRETPQLLPHESLEEFHELFASFEDYGKPRICATIWRCISTRCLPGIQAVEIRGPRHPP